MPAITPRRTRLVRVPDLRAFREAIAAIAGHRHPAVIVVPTRVAAMQLAAGAIAATRDELYDHFHSRLAAPPRRLAVLERGVILNAAARAAADSTHPAIRLRPGLIAEILRFYDHLRRQSQSVDRFEALMDEALGSDDLDRGARRLRQQTRFLAETFRDYDRRVRLSGACDEHILREQLMAEPAADPIRHAIVTVPDWIADADGLFVADFDLLARVPRLETIDIVATESILGSGFHERLHSWWPGIEEIDRRSAVSGRPVLVSPRGSPADEPWWTVRDREEELVAVARRLKADRRAGVNAPADRTAVVFKRPLPYLYLAREVFQAAGIHFQAFDGFPLAAEPTAAALDLILDAAAATFTRDAIVSLLRSPHFRFAVDGVEPSSAAIAALDRALSDARYLGDASRLESLAEEWSGSASPAKHAALPAIRAAIAAARELEPLTQPGPASERVRQLSDFWQRHLRTADDDSPFRHREERARTAVFDALTALEAASVAHDDPVWTIDELCAAVRRSIEDQTFDVGTAARGVVLLDDKAARYRDFDDLTIVGIVEHDWPERPRRNIFYPPQLLKALGWPSEKDRRAASDAHFLDLITSASTRTVLSTFTLDDDALVSRSLQLDDVARAKLSVVPQATAPPARIFLDEALSLEPIAKDVLDANARVWADVRMTRTPLDADRFHGAVTAMSGRTWSVSALETYLGCPFRFFAQHVLKLEEEPDDEEIMNPRRQGQFAHEVFERFFSAWQKAGHGAVTTENLEQARILFTDIVDEALAQLPDAEAGLERTRLLGSPAAAGLGEAVMRMEAERPIPVVQRLLEHELNGSFVFATANGPRSISIRGKADRIDLLADGTFRVIDYKLGWPPKDKRKALQLPIYSVCASQLLASTRAGGWTASEAVYLAFKGPKRVIPLFQNEADRDRIFAEAQDRLAETVDAIASGHFPPTPDDVYRCESCGFGSVCRKDYVGDV